MLKFFTAFVLALASLQACSIVKLEKKAQEGEHSALNALGEIYHFALCGAKQDLEKARQYYLNAVKKGSAEAANHLGRLYCNGEGVEVDYDQAEYWYKKSAQLDSSIQNQCDNGQIDDECFCALAEIEHISFHNSSVSSAQVQLARIYLRGLKKNGKYIIKPNKQKAFQLFQKAAENGSGRALLEIAVCYRFGIGCTANIELSKIFVERAKKAGVCLLDIEQAFKN